MAPGERIDAGPPIAILGALVLLGSLFLDWYEPGFSAWTVFEVLDLLLASLALACLFAAATRLGLAPRGVGLPSSGHFAVFATLALALVISQLVNHPPAAVGEDPETGLWLGLGGSALMALGGLLSVTRISLAVDVEGRDAARAGGSSAPGGFAAGGPRVGTGPADVAVGGEPTVGEPPVGEPPVGEPRVGKPPVGEPPVGKPMAPAGGEEETRPLDAPPHERGQR